MRKYLLTIGVGLALSSAAVVSSLAAPPAGMKTLPGHVPPAAAQSAAKSKLAPDTDLNLAIGLPVRNQEALGQLLARIYDPASSDYRRFLSPEEFAELFGPSQGDYEAVIDFAQKHGLKVTGTSPNRMLLNVSGKAQNVERAFNVTLGVYSDPTEPRDFFAPDSDPTVSAALPIQDISGLDNFRRPRSQYKIKPSAPAKTKLGTPVAPATSAANPNAGSGPGGNYIGDDFRRAYVPGTALNGSGQIVGLVQFDGYLQSDIIAYENLAGRTNIPLQNVLIDGFSGVPTGNGGEVEVSLDIEMVISMAPALARVMVYEGNPFNFHPNNVLNRIATDNQAKQISCSWGWVGGPTATTDQIFQQLALQGQTFFTSSGDFDAYRPGEVDNPFMFGTPAANPFVTSVGGTTLTMGGLGVTYASETVWNWGIRFGQDGFGSAGGFSSSYPIPTWQTNINMPSRGGSATGRNFPDVSLTADDTFVIAQGGFQFFGVGGTSVAAPLWAGFMALVNQQAAGSGRPPIGFINPAIYGIATGVNYTNCFRDITTGNNAWSGSPTLFIATNNYDLCTGLGSPNGTNLINALAVATNPVTHISPPPPPYGTNLAKLNGSNPNGTWSLFIQDDTVPDSGIISNGWCITLTTASLVGFASDNELAMTSPNSTVALGSNVVYFMTVTNYGPSVSSNTIVSDSLPDGTLIVSTNTTQGSVIRSGSDLVWNVGTLAVNAGAQLTLIVKPVSAGVFINFASVSSGTTDPNPDDDSVTVAVDVQVPQPPQIGGATLNGSGKFQLTISNPTNPAVPTVVQVSTNLLTWANVFTGMPPFTYTDQNSTNFPRRFYRAVLQLP